MTLKEAVRTFVVRRKFSKTAINAMSTDAADSVAQCLSKHRCPIPQAIVTRTSMIERQRLSACAFWHVSDIAGVSHLMSAEIAAHLGLNRQADLPRRDT